MNRSLAFLFFLFFSVALLNAQGPTKTLPPNNSNTASSTTSLTPDRALQRLMEGNRRYVSGNLSHPNVTQESREAVLNTQTPFAIILGCSDSRVPPEIIFDQGLGDLFVVRVAGNVAGSIELDSIDFSALNLGSSIILVLGHQNCGAVNAVLNHKTGVIEDIATLIEPSYLSTRNQPGDPLENAIKENVRTMVRLIRESDNIPVLIREGKVNVIGGYYHLESGEVEILK